MEPCSLSLCYLDEQCVCPASVQVWTVDSAELAWSFWLLQEERAHQNRFSEARRKCRELAWQYRQRGEFGLAEQLYQQGARYAEQEEEEAKLASRRIGKRV